MLPPAQIETHSVYFRTFQRSCEIKASLHGMCKFGNLHKSSDNSYYHTELLAAPGCYHCSTSEGYCIGNAHQQLLVGLVFSHSHSHQQGSSILFKTHGELHVEFVSSGLTAMLCQKCNMKVVGLGVITNASTLAGLQANQLVREALCQSSSLLQDGLPLDSCVRTLVPANGLTCPGKYACSKHNRRGCLPHCWHCCSSSGYNQRRELCSLHKAHPFHSVQQLLNMGPGIK